MNWLFGLPLSLRLAGLFVIGCAIASLLNWAIYALAWNRRAISPWMRPAKQAPPRKGTDRIPVLGWLGLRRETPVHGRGFWVRPLLIELLFGLGLVLLYHWEVVEAGLYREQLLSMVPRALIVGMPLSETLLHTQFLLHVVLLCLMVVASFIDIDEKLIPEEITDLGVLAGLLLLVLFPGGLLPQVTPQVAQPTGGVALERAAGDALVFGGRVLYAHPVYLTAPIPWPANLQGRPHGSSLALGLGCFWFWCVAIIHWNWRARRGWVTATRVVLARVLRELRRPPLLVVALLGSLGIAAVWWQGGPRWATLLTALVGLVASGGIVWAVRIIAAAALRREAMGFGDVTLMMMIGVFLGWQACLVLFFLAPVAGLVVGVAQWVLRNDNVIPYGPFLCLAALVVVVRWADIWVYVSPIFGVPGLVPMVLLVCVPLMFLLLGLLQFIKSLFAYG